MMNELLDRIIALEAKQVEMDTRLRRAEFRVRTGAYAQIAPDPAGPTNDQGERQ